MKNKRGMLMTRFFALLICVVLLLGSIPATATDYQDDTENPADTSVGESVDPPASDETLGSSDGEGTEDPAPDEGEDATIAEGEDATIAEGEDVTLPEDEDATVAEGEDATVAEGEDATEADPEVSPTPKKKLAKLAKTGAKNEVGKETTDKYEITYTKTASVKTPSTAYSFNGLTKISIRVKDVPDGKAQWVRAIVYDPNNATPAESITYKSDDWPLPDYVERVIGSDNSVTLNIDIGKADKSLHFVKDGSKAYSLQFTTAEDTEGGLISHGRSFFLDEEGPEIVVKNFDSDQWRTPGFYFGLYVDDNTGIGQDDDGNELVTASEGTVDEWDDSTFNYMVTLDQRATDDTVTVTAEDELGNKTQKQVDVKIDADAPSLELIESSSTYGAKQSFIVKATDSKSGVDAESFAFTGGEFTVTPVTDQENQYKVEISADGDLTVKDNVKNTSTALTLTLNRDETAPAADDVSVKFYVVSELEEMLGKIFHLHGDGLFGNNNDLKMRVMVSSAGGSAIKSITAKNGDNALTAAAEAPVYVESLGLYVMDFLMPVSTDAVYDDVTLQITDEAGNTSEAIKLSDLTKIYAGKDSVDKTIEKVANITILPLVTNPAYTDDVYTKSVGEGDNKELYAKAGAGFTLNAEEGVGGIYSLKLYFDSADKFDAQNKPTAGAAVVTADMTGPDGFTVTDGVAVVDDKDNVPTQVSFSYSIPEKPTGKYVLYAEAQNCARNAGSFSRVIYVDNDAPVIAITGYSVINSDESESAYDTANWTNKPIKVTYTVTDKPDGNHSGVKSSAVAGSLKNDFDESVTPKLESESGGVRTYSFISKYNQTYSITAKDNLDNEALSVTTPQLKYDEDKPVIGAFKYGDNKDDIKDVDWATAENGIRVSFTIDDKSTNTPTGTKGTLSGVDLDNVTVTPVAVEGSPSTFKPVALDRQENDGVYTYTFTAYDFAQYKVECADIAGNPNDATTATIKIDKDKPVISGVTFDKESSAGSAVLRLLTFGLYSNDKYKVTVSVSDAKPSSAIKEITMTVKNSDGSTRDITPKTTSYGACEADPMDAGEVDAQAVFIVDKETLSDENNVIFSVTDNAGNQAADTDDNGDPITDIPLKNLKHKGIMHLLHEALGKTDADSADDPDGNVFEVVNTDEKPAVTSTGETSGDGDYTDGSGNHWYSAKNHGVLKTAYAISEDKAKLFSAKLTLNGSNMLDDLGNTAADTEKTDGVIHYKKKTASDTLTFEPDLASHTAIKRTSSDGDAENGGLNTLALEVVANSGNKTPLQEAFYVDDTSPVITQIAYSGDGRADNPLQIDENGTIITRIRRNANASKNYGYYFKGNTTMTVTASDFKTPAGGAVNGCDVKAIHIYLDPLGPSYLSGPRDYVLDGDKLTKLETGEVTASFTMRADFKGKVYVYAVDNVDNRSDNYYPDATIAEKSATHDSHSSANINITTATDKKDNNGNPLYKEDVSFTLTVADSYNGLQYLHYSVTSRWADGTLSEGEVEIGQTDTSVAGWKILEKDNNLITKVSKTIRLDSSSRFNYNDLVLHVDAKDRAGFAISCPDKTISIDTTAPVITLTPRSATANYYDPDSKNYYQDTLTFDITVRERNFDPEEFAKAAIITAREGSAPAIIGADAWSTSYTDYSADSTHTATISFASDGDFTVELGYTDQAGNTGASVKSEDFVIDTIDPVLSVTFDNNNPSNGNYYGTARVATVTVEEHNFAEGDGYITYSLVATEGDNRTPKSTPQMALSGWGGGGDTHSTTINFDTDGSYAFTVTYKDKAARNANEVKVDTFIIDLGLDKDGAIIFTKDTADHAFGKEKVTPGVKFFDNNLDHENSVATLTRISYDPATGTKKATPEGLKSTPGSTTTEKTENYEDFPDEEKYDGIYVYSAKIMDKAGHTDTKSIVFSVNRYGATYMCDDDATKELLDTGYTNDVGDDLKITEINVTEIKEYSVTSTVGTDIETLSETASGDSGFERRKIAGGNNASWYKYEYSIHKSNFGKEGDYTVTLGSKIEYTDAEQDTEMTNTTTRVEERSFPIKFTVDKTPPEITISGVAADKAYSEAEKDVKIICVDKNINPETLEIRLNNETLTADKYTMSVLDGEIDIVLPINTNQTQETYNLEVSVGDLAKNVANNDEAKNFILSATFLTMFFHNTLAVILTSVGLAAAVAVVILLILKKRKKAAK